MVKAKDTDTLIFMVHVFAVAVSICTSSEYQQKSVFQQLPKETSAARLTEKLGELTTVNKKLTCQVMSFIQKRIPWDN